MSSGIRFSLRSVYKVQTRALSALSAEKPIEQRFVSTVRTAECSPSNHTISHLRKVYVVPETVQKALFSWKETPKYFQQDVEMFGEPFCLIRRPAIEILSYLKQTDYTRPINKYVIYGKNGTGKTRTLLHVLHYAYEQKFLLFYVPWPQMWFRFPKEASYIEEEDVLDLPVDSGAWLQFFKNQNKQLLEELKLTTSRSYSWSQRESSDKGVPLQNIIDFGINRIKYASAVIEALIYELKLASNAGMCKVFVAIDGFNAFLSDHTQIKNPLKKFVPAEKIILSNIFTNIIKTDWCNGAVVVTVDQLATKTKRESELPLYLLGEEGFELLDPFIPIELGNYDDQEFDTIIDYYIERKFIRDISTIGRQELKIISSRAPLSLLHACKPL